MSPATQVYEIKRGNTWFQVRATSMTAVNQHCKENGYANWRMCGMMSRAELIAAQTLEIVG